MSVTWLNLTPAITFGILRLIFALKQGPGILAGRRVRRMARKQRTLKWTTERQSYVVIGNSVIDVWPTIRLNIFEIVRVRLRLSSHLVQTFPYLSSRGEEFRQEFGLITKVGAANRRGAPFHQLLHHHLSLQPIEEVHPPLAAPPLNSSRTVFLIDSSSSSFTSVPGQFSGHHLVVSSVGSSAAMPASSVTSSVEFSSPRYGFLIYSSSSSLTSPPGQSTGHRLVITSVGRSAATPASSVTSSIEFSSPRSV